MPQRRVDASFLDVARECEDLGYDAVSVFDHLAPLGAPDGTPALESFTALAAVAAATSRIGVVTLVARAAARPPAMTAHLARTVRAVAGERFVLGLGTGDASSAREDALLGQPHLDGPARRDRLRETVAAVREVVADATIWIGGNGAKTRAVAIEVGADAWNVWASGPEEVADATVADATIAHATIPVTWGGQVVLGATAEEAAARLAGWTPGRGGKGGARGDTERDRALTGTPDEVAARLRALADAGVVEAIVAFVGGEAAEQRRVFAREVLPAVR